MLTKQLPTPQDLKLRHIAMLPLPWMPMQRKALTLGLRNTREDAHLHNRHRRIELRKTHDRTVNESAPSTHCQSHMIRKAILPAVPAETPRDALPARSRIVLVLFQRAAGVVDFDFFFFDDEVRGYVGAGYFAAVGAVAQVPAFARKEVCIVDGNFYFAAETRRAHAAAVLGRVVRVGVACEFRWVCHGRWFLYGLVLDRERRRRLQTKRGFTIRYCRCASIYYTSVPSAAPPALRAGNVVSGGQVRHLSESSLFRSSST